MLDEVYRDLYSTNVNEWRNLLKDKDFANAVLMSRAKLSDDFKVKNPDIAKTHHDLSTIEKSKYAKDAADYLKSYIDQEKSKAEFATKSNVSDPKGVEANQLRLDRLNALEAKLAEETTPKEGVKYADMTDLQKYTFGQEFGLNYFNDDDRKKLDETATKLQEQARIKREYAADRNSSNPVTIAANVAKDIFTPASQNARRRGEEPTWKDYALDAANIAATFAPGGLGLVSKFANAGKLAKGALAAGDILANTATSTAIDARDLKGEDEEMNWSRAASNLPKNLALSVAGTAAGAAASREVLPSLAKSTIGQIIPDIDTKLGKYLTNEAVEARKAIKDYGKSFTVDDVLKSNIYPDNVKQEVAKYFKREKANTHLLKTYGLDDATLKQIGSNTINTRALDFDNVTVADLNNAIDANIAEISKKVKSGQKLGAVDEALMRYAIATKHRLNQPDYRNVMQAETAVARKRNVPLTDYQAIYSPTKLQKVVDYTIAPSASAIARSKIYGRDRQDPDAPWTVYTDPNYQKAKSKKEQYGDYQVIFLPDRFQKQYDKWGNIFGLETAEDAKLKK